jgi:hypothetical protein
VSGLTSRSRREHVWAALVDQVAADGARLLQQIDAVAGPHARVVTGGGWAQSAWFAAAKRRHLPDVTATTLPQPGRTAPPCWRCRRPGRPTARAAVPPLSP